MYQTPTVQRSSVNADADFVRAKFLGNKGHVNGAIFFGGPGAVNRVMWTWNINLAVKHTGKLQNNIREKNAKHTKRGKHFNSPSTVIFKSP